MLDKDNKDFLNSNFDNVYQNNNTKSFLEIEDELNEALGNIGNNRESDIDIDEKIASWTVQELLQDMKIDEFERLYITTASQTNSRNFNNIPEDKISEVKTLAEYELSRKNQDEVITPEEKERLENASNFYLMPHTVKQKYLDGAVEQTKLTDLYTVNDVEGYSLYSIINNEISISTSFRSRIESYLEEHYAQALQSGKISKREVIEHFSPKNMTELYDVLSSNSIISVRFLPDRIDELAKSKGITSNAIDGRQVNLEEYDNLDENTKVKQRALPDTDNKEDKEQTLETEPKEDLEEPNIVTGKVRDGASVRLKEDREDKKNEETYIEKIARRNHVSPAVVNTRVIENFEKVEEDTGIHLKGRYARGEVVAVRIPYKLSYRTFLVEKSTGMTIDGKGRLERNSARLYDFDEMEDYFRFKLRYGQDGGDSGKPLRYDEGRDYTTYIDENGELKQQKYINNGKKLDMLREERQRYLTEVEEVDRKLKEAIDEYQKKPTHENYNKVRDLIQEKVNIDNKYNALDEQREITEKTKENVEHIIQKDLDDDDDEWYPGMGRFHH